jgi:hypothetical protein
MILRGTMVYLSIGAVIWLVLDRLGIVAGTLVSRPDAPPRSLVLASLMTILAWPVFVASWLRGMWRSL